MAPHCVVLSKIHKAGFIVAKSAHPTVKAWVVLNSCAMLPTRPQCNSSVWLVRRPITYSTCLERQRDHANIIRVQQRGARTLYFQVVRLRLPHQQRRRLAVQRVCWVGVEQQLWQKRLEHVEQICAGQPSVRTPCAFNTGCRGKGTNKQCSTKCIQLANSIHFPILQPPFSPHCILTIPHCTRVKHRASMRTEHWTPGLIDDVQAHRPRPARVQRRLVPSGAPRLPGICRWQKRRYGNAYLVYVAVCDKGGKADTINKGMGTHISSTFGWYMRLTKPMEGDLYG